LQGAVRVISEPEARLEYAPLGFFEQQHRRFQMFAAGAQVQVEFGLVLGSGDQLDQPLRLPERRTRAAVGLIPHIVQQKLTHAGQSSLFFGTHHMDGYTDGARLVRQCELDRLPDPPFGVRREAETPLGIELLAGFQEAEIAFRDQIRQGQPTIAVPAGDHDDEAEMMFDEAAASALIAARGASGQNVFLAAGEPLARRDVAQILPDDVPVARAGDTGFQCGSGAQRTQRSALLVTAAVGKIIELQGEAQALVGQLEQAL